MSFILQLEKYNNLSDVKKFAKKQGIQTVYIENDTYLMMECDNQLPHVLATCELNLDRSFERFIKNIKEWSIEIKNGRS